jgi:hypothetical protein
MHAGYNAAWNHSTVSRSKLAPLLVKRLPLSPPQGREPVPADHSLFQEDAEGVVRHRLATSGPTRVCKAASGPTRVHRILRVKPLLFVKRLLWARAGQPPPVNPSVPSPRPAAVTRKRRGVAAGAPKRRTRCTNRSCRAPGGEGAAPSPGAAR